MQNGSLNSMVKYTKSKRILRRAIALMSAVVLLVTVNSLKLNAVTLERVPMCGYAEEHVHDAGCYVDGALACGLEEHTHTDACFQESPVRVAEIEDADLGTDIPVEEEFELSDEGPDREAGAETDADGTGEGEPDIELPAIVSESAEPVFSLLERDHIAASEIVEALSLAPEAVTAVFEVIPDDVNAEDYLPVLAIEPVDGDYIVTPARDFAECEIAIETADDLIPVKLTDGAAAAAEESALPDGDAEETLAEQADGEAGEPAPADGEEPAPEEEAAVDDPADEAEEQSEDIEEQPEDVEEPSEDVEEPSEDIEEPSDEAGERFDEIEEQPDAGQASA